jgi:hypothetical protein
VPSLVKKVYKLKQREEVQKMEVDPERTTGQDIIQIGSMDVSIAKDGKRTIVPNNKVVTSTPGVFAAANDHEASGSGSNSKYFLPRWCPPGLTHTQRRKLQRLRSQEKREKELEKQRDEAFNHPWYLKEKSGESRPAPNQHRSERWRGRSDRSHRLDRWTSMVRLMTRRHRPVSLLRFPWFVMTSPHWILHQKTMRSLLTTVLRPSA